MKTLLSLFLLIPLALLQTGCSSARCCTVARYILPPPDGEPVVSVLLRDGSRIELDESASQRWITTAAPEPRAVIVATTLVGDSIEITADRILGVELRSRYPTTRVTAGRLLPTYGEVVHSVTLADSSVVTFDEYGGRIRLPPGAGGQGWLVAGRNEQGRLVEISTRYVIDAHIRSDPSMASARQSTAGAAVFVIAVLYGVLLTCGSIRFH